MSNLPLFVYVDVDDTFVRTASSKRIPIPAVIEHVRRLKEEGAILYCWSSGGADYAKMSAEEFGILDCFQNFLPKPNVFLDDMAVETWPRTAVVHPGSCAGRRLDDYRQLLGDQVGKK